MQPPVESTGGSTLGGQAVVVGGILVGFLVIPMVAGAAPEIVNGLLLLMLIGAILMNSGIWLPYLAQFGNVIGPTATPGTPGTTPTQPQTPYSK